MSEKKQDNTPSPAVAAPETLVPAALIARPAAASAPMSAPDASEPDWEKHLQDLEKHLRQLHENRFEKKGARAVFHLVNFGGLHQAFNNIASVVITYVMATTHFADSLKDKMADTAVGKGLSTVLSLPGKAVNGAFKLASVDLNKELKSLPKEERAAELAFRAAKSQRSAIETAFMCVAGFIALAPVWYLENHRVGFLNKVDNWLHPGRSKEEQDAAALKPGDEPHETWWNLIRARIVALAVVFGVDQTRDNIDSILRHKHKSQNLPGMYKNVDTVFGWGLGDKIYNELSPETRGWLARFFSGNLKGEKITLSGIQHETRGDVLEITKAPDFVRQAGKEIAALGDQIHKIRLTSNDKGLIESLERQIKTIDEKVRAQGGVKAVERAVFAEQARLFLTKEVFLTTILSVVIYACTKSAAAHKVLETIGLAKKGAFAEEKARREAMRNGHSLPDSPETSIEPKDEQSGKFAAAVGHKKPLAEPVSFQDSLLQKTNPEASISV